MFSDVSSAAEEKSASLDAKPVPTNFVDAKNEIAFAFKKLQTTPLKEYLSSQDCDWIDFSRNTPALHVGGIWERQIRTTRSVLSSLLLDHGTQLYGKSLRTLTTEAESIVNCRAPDSKEPLRRVSTRTAALKPPADT